MEEQGEGEGTYELDFGFACVLDLERERRLETCGLVLKHEECLMGALGG